MYYIEAVERRFHDRTHAVNGNLRYGIWNDTDYDTCMGTYETRKEALDALKRLRPSIKTVDGVFYRTDYELWEGEWDEDGELYDSVEFLLDTTDILG